MSAALPVKLVLFIVGLSLGFGASRGCSAAAEDDMPAVAVNDAGYARLVYKGPDLRGCVCCAMVPEAGVHCHCRNDAGAWGEVVVP